MHGGGGAETSILMPELKSTMKQEPTTCPKSALAAAVLENNLEEARRLISCTAFRLASPRPRMSNYPFYSQAVNCVGGWERFLVFKLPEPKTVGRGRLACGGPKWVRSSHSHSRTLALTLFYTLTLSLSLLHAHTISLVASSPALPSYSAQALECIVAKKY